MRFRLIAVFLSATVCPAQQTQRDWFKNPAIVEIDTDQDIYAVSDPHGDPARLSQVLTGAKIIKAPPITPQDVEWTAGRAVLVVAGDLIDKGGDSLTVIGLLRALSASAATAGGQVVIAMGNHEAEFLADPKGSKTEEFSNELLAAQLDPVDVAACNGDLGQFLCGLPFAVRVNDWFFSHAGNTDSRTIPMLAKDFENAVNQDGFNSDQFIGNNSILEARLNSQGPNGKPWIDVTGDEKGLLATLAAHLNVAHLVQGHQPGSVNFLDGKTRQQGQMYQRWGLLFLIDTGMSQGVDNSLGAAMRIDAQTGIAEAICPNGARTTLWDPKSKPATGRAAACAE
jgi:hypothetical protein